MLELVFSSIHLPILTSVPGQLIVPFPALASRLATDVRTENILYSTEPPHCIPTSCTRRQCRALLSGARAMCQCVSIPPSVWSLWPAALQPPMVPWTSFLRLRLSTAWRSTSAQRRQVESRVAGWDATICLRVEQYHHPSCRYGLSVLYRSPEQFSIRLSFLSTASPRVEVKQYSRGVVTAQVRSGPDFDSRHSEAETIQRAPPRRSGHISSVRDRRARIASGVRGCIKVREPWPKLRTQTQTVILAPFTSTLLYPTFSIAIPIKRPMDVISTITLAPSSVPSSRAHGAYEADAESGVIHDAHTAQKGAAQCVVV